MDLGALLRLLGIGLLFGAAGAAFGRTYGLCFGLAAVGVALLERRLGAHAQECHGPELELPTNDAIGMQAEPVSIKPKRSIQIIDTDGQHAYARLHEALNVDA